LLCCVWQPAHGQANKLQYELQERCGKQAAETFKKEWDASGAQSDITGNYENHYSARLNKCFYLEIGTSYQKQKDQNQKDEVRMLKSMRLFDLHENKEYGQYYEGYILICEVQGTKCNSEAEWRQLAKPYLEE
jgi:hypothetical protein